MWSVNFQKDLAEMRSFYFGENYSIDESYWILAEFSDLVVVVVVKASGYKTWVIHLT